MEDKMPQSLSRILVHLLFSTKNREPYLTQEIRSELHPYLAVVLRENGCFSLQVGGVEEHDRCQSGYDENYVWD